MISGVTIDLAHLPVHMSIIDSTPKDPIKKSIMGGVIADMLSEGTIEVAPYVNSRRSFYSRFFLVPKRDGAFRAILDLSRLNKLVRPKYFKMHHLQDILPLLNRFDWMATIDISQAYHSLLIAKKDRNFLLFKFNGLTYRYRCLPMGYTGAPRIFTRVMKVVVAYIREKFKIGVSSYIDDIFLFRLPFIINTNLSKCV